MNKDGTGRSTRVQGGRCSRSSMQVDYKHKDVRSEGRRRVLRGIVGGKSELRRAWCRVTPGRRFRPATESATENKPPMAPSGAQARVKGCGKSAPGRRRRGSHGKPHLEQGQIRDEELLAPPESRVGRTRPSAMSVPDK